MSERIDGATEPTDEIAEMLARLKPAGSGVSRDRLIFLAGRQDALRERSTHGRRWWPLATAASWLVTAGMLSMWTLSPERPPNSGVVGNVAPESVVQSYDRSLPPSSAAQERDTIAPVAESGGRRREASPPLGTLGMGKDLPRLSLVGWQSWQLASRSRADADAAPTPGEIVDTPPATYSRLMKLYLDHQANLEFQGDLL